LAATLVQTLHLYPLSFPLTPHIEIQFQKLLFVPLVVLVLSWLSSHLIQNTQARIVMKSFSWIYALVLLLVDLAFFLGVVLQYNISGTPLVVGFLWVPGIIYLASIRKHYRKLFPDSEFLKSNKTQVIFCMIIIVFTTLQFIFTAPIIPS
jgi:hypothetical protein